MPRGRQWCGCRRLVSCRRGFLAAKCGSLSPSTPSGAVRLSAPHAASRWEGPPVTPPARPPARLAALGSEGTAWCATPTPRTAGAGCRGARPGRAAHAVTQPLEVVRSHPAMSTTSARRRCSFVLCGAEVCPSLPKPRQLWDTAARRGAVLRSACSACFCLDPGENGALRGS